MHSPKKDFWKEEQPRRRDRLLAYFSPIADNKTEVGVGQIITIETTRARVWGSTQNEQSK